MSTTKHRRPPLALGIRLMRMLWRMLTPIAIAGVLLGAAHLLGASEELIRQARAVSIFVVGFSLALALIQEVLSPHRRNMRLLDIRGFRAERLYLVARALLLTLLGTELLIYLADVNAWNPAVRALIELLRNMGLIIFGASAISRSGLFQRITPSKAINSQIDLARWFFVRRIWPVSVLVALFWAVAHALGYNALARWVVANAGWSLVILLLARMSYRFIRLRINRAVHFIQREEQQGGDEVTEPSPTWVGVEKIVLGGLKTAFIIGAIGLVLRVWGISLTDILTWDDVLLFGSFGPSLSDVSQGVLGVLLVFAFGAILRNLLIFIIFPKADVAIGARYAVLAILRYTVVILGVLLGLGAFGVDTGSLAWFAGAASFGLMFGLQDIFGNFFSGLIMLLEQPVRVGDTVQVGETAGRVEAVRLRGTTIRTFDNTTVTIPNKAMIGERLTNLSHDMANARMKVVVGVSYESDPAEVERVLLDVARADERVSQDPGPIVRFQSFGESSLDFELWAWTEQTSNRWAIASELRAAVLRAFRSAEIEIPFPQRDLRIVFDARQEELRRQIEDQLPTS